MNFEVTVTFAGGGAKTNLTMRMLFPSAAARDHVVKKYGAIEGANQTLDRLAEQLAQMAERQIAEGETAAGKNDPADRELVITRIFDAPREIVFKAWTEPERLKHWWGPKEFTNPVCELDLRPGGAIRIHIRGPMAPFTR